MLDEEKINSAIDRIMARFDEVNSFFIAKIASQIMTIGELNASSVNRIILMTEMGANIEDITQRLRLATNTGIREMMRVYQTVLDDTYSDPRFQQALQHTAITAADRARITQYAQAVSMQTARRLTNLSNTTAISGTYREAVDKAILAVSSGLTDYKAATRQVVSTPI